MKSKQYKWIILASSVLIFGVAASIVNAVQTLFIQPVTKAYDFSISSFSAIFSIGAIVMGLLAPIVGKLLEKISIKLIMSIGSILVGVGFASYSFCNHIISFYIVAIIIYVGMTLLTTIPISTMITNYFVEKKGSALGIAFSGMGIGTFFWMQITSRLLTNQGFHFAYLLLGIIILIVTLPICLFLVRLKPESANTKESATRVTTEKKEKRKFTPPKGFIQYSIGLFLLGIAIAGTQVHIQSYLTTLNYSATYGANVGSLLAMFAIAGNIIAGLVFDKLNTKIAVTIFTIGICIGYVFLIFAYIPIIPYLYSAFFGLCLSLPALWPSYGVSKLFTSSNYAVTLGIASLFFTVGASLGPIISGAIVDYMGSYRTVWFLYLIIVVLFLFISYRGITLSESNKKPNPANRL